MISMQYSFPLPADYDVGRVRTRVAERGHVFDDFDGLAFKAFLAAEKSERQSENLYAPFYLWNTAQGMNDFLTGDKFEGVSQAFGWPAIDVWQVLGANVKPSARTATLAQKSVTELGRYADLAEMKADQNVFLEDASGRNEVAAAVIGFEPNSWRAVRFLLLTEGTDLLSDVPSISYEALHISAPGL